MEEKEAKASEKKMEVRWFISEDALIQNFSRVNRTKMVSLWAAMTTDVEMSTSMEVIRNMLIKMQHMRPLLWDMEREATQSSGWLDKHGDQVLATKGSKSLRSQTHGLILHIAFNLNGI